jgi:hypothetical protein
MNKKANTLLFILCATIFNILIAIISFIGLTLLYIRFVMVLMPEGGRSWAFSMIFLASIAISFMVYRFVLKFLLTKVKVEDYFDPLFIRRNMKKQTVESEYTVTPIPSEPAVQEDAPASEESAESTESVESPAAHVDTSGELFNTESAEEESEEEEPEESGSK